MTYKFKTNLKCNGCIEAVKPLLDELTAIDNWHVDLESPDKVLTIEALEPISLVSLLQGFENKGYSIEML